jgi:hypothetical protein
MNHVKRLAAGGVIAVLGFSAIAVYQYRNATNESRQTASDFLERRMRTVATIMQQLVAPGLEVGLDDFEALSNDLEMWSLGDPDISYVNIISSNGAVAGAYQRSQNPISVVEQVRVRRIDQESGIMRLHAGTFHFSLPLLSQEGENLGALHLGVDSSSIDHAEKSASIGGLTTGLAVLLFGLIFAAGWGFFLTRPLLGGPKDRTSGRTSTNEETPSQTLATVAQLRTDGLISDEDFEAKKAEILTRI